MAIISSDLNFFAAEYSTDETHGGGRMTATVVQDGVENLLFPDIDDTARAAGRVQLRKLFLAVTSGDTDALMGARMGFESKPADAGVSLVAYRFGNADTARAAAVAALGALPYDKASSLAAITNVVAQAVPTGYFEAPTLGSILAGDVVGFYADSPGTLLRGVARVTLIEFPPSAPTKYTVDSIEGAQAGGYVARMQASPNAVRCVGPAELVATSGASAVELDKVEAYVVPAITPYPTVVNGINPAGLRLSGGRVPIFRPGDAVVLKDGATTEIAVVSAVDAALRTLTFTDPLANSYPAGSIACAMLALGDLQASVGASFSQQTWTKVFSDALIGNSINANYNRGVADITTTNLGATDQRWAIVFTSATEFRLIGESLGQIATGDITTEFSPLNPVTNTPYFSILAAGWGGGWGIGNVLRFNTRAASAPVWVARTISPSPAGAVDGVLLSFRGAVNA